MRADIKVHNLPKSFLDAGKYMVVRLVDARVWFYGTYDDEDRALQVAIEIGNGFVVEVIGNVKDRK